MKILIIGTGLAGITMSKQLLNRGCDVVVMTSNLFKSSTAYATGMYNPVVFRRLQLSWMVDDLLPEMHKFLKELEDLLGPSLYQPISFKKKIPNEDYEGWWNAREETTEFKPYLGPIDQGFGRVLNAGMVNCTSLQEKYISYLYDKGILRQDEFDYSKLVVGPDQCHYNGKSYDFIIFCEGPHAVNNPYFNWLPFKLCQGEWLIIKTEEELTNEVINHKVNIIPMGDNHYKLSSTYSWHTLDWKPSQEAADELLSQFKELFDVPFKIADHQAGLRPTVADRRPYLGKHPEHPRLVIFNGLGSKGVMLAPYFAKQLTAHIIDGQPLLPEVDINRHIKRYMALRN